MTPHWQCIAYLVLLVPLAAVSPQKEAQPDSRMGSDVSVEYATVPDQGESTTDLLEWADATAAVAARTTNLNLRIESMGRNTIVVPPRAAIAYRVIGELSDDANQGLALFGFDLHFEGGPLPQGDEPTGEPTPGCDNPMINFDRPWGITNPAGFGGTPINGDLIQVGGGQNTINNTPDNALFPIGPVLPGVAQPSGCGPAVLLTGRLTVPAVAGRYRLIISSVFANVIREDTTGNPFWATAAAGVGSVEDLYIVVSTFRPHIRAETK